MLRSQQGTFAMLEILDKDSRSEDKRRDLEGKLANESVCELAFRVYALPHEYLLSLKEASSEPYTVSLALICRCTCLWWAGLGLCSCWTCSPERAEQGKEKASACLFIFYFLWRALHASCRIFWVISFQKQVFLVKQQRSNTQENIKKKDCGGSVSRGLLQFTVSKAT